MGQAFDRDGHVLGEAEGATKREVFDKLQAAHGDAHEIRIRSAEAQAAAAPRSTRIADVLLLTGETLLKFFEYEHLPPKLQAASKPFAELAMDIAQRQVKQAERTVALRKLLEAKDASVRCELP